jgi:phage terminase large subunit GpA-like protein
MSGNFSPTSPTSPSLLADDGAILQAFSDGLRPDPIVTVSQWADQHRVLGTISSSEHGQWRTSRTPYLRGIMDDLSASSPVQRVVFMKSSQLGGTEAGLNWLGYVIDHAPGPTLVVQPTTSLVRRFSQQRLDPLISASDRLRLKIPPARTRDSGNTLYSKEFPGGILVLTGANSAAALRSMPARYIFMDEVDAYPGDLEEEGDPVTLAEARTRTFGRRRKVLLVSTPTIRNMSRIEREYEKTDKRRFFLPCPHCGEAQWLKFENLRWTRGAPDDAHYVCEENGCVIEEHHKTRMLAEGFWRATAVSAEVTTVGYHLSSLYSPIGWQSWADIAAQWEAAQGSDDAIKAFKNSVLGETWVETGDAPDWQTLLDRRESYKRGTVPSRAVLLTAGVDVQRDRLEASVWAWGPGMESWLVDHRVIDGGALSADAWDELEDLLSEPFEREDGSGSLSIKRMAIDTGYETQAVYAWVRKIGSPEVLAVKGKETFDRSQPVSGPTQVDVKEGKRRVIKKGVKLWTVAVSTFKAETYRWLRLHRAEVEGEPDPAGYIHFPEQIDGEYFRQFTAEQLVTTKNRRGFTRYEWHKLRERNEALDCRVYARAAAAVLGLDHWSPHRWQAAAAPGKAPPRLRAVRASTIGEASQREPLPARDEPPSQGRPLTRPRRPKAVRAAI